MPAQQQHYISTVYLVGTTSTVAAGSVLCLTAGGTRYVVASAANRAAAGRRSACLALTVGDVNNIGVEAQWVGTVSPLISGLGTGTASLIRTSSAGILERVAVFNSADDVCGTCDTDGTAYVCFPLVGMSLSLGVGGVPGGALNSVQYNAGASTFGGAARVGISTDGDLAFPGEWYAYADGPSGTKIPVFGYYTDTGTDKLFLIGSDGTETKLPALLMQALKSAGVICYSPGGAGIAESGFSARRSLPNGTTCKDVLAFPNLVVGRASEVNATTDKSNGAVGQLTLLTAGQTNPSATPSGAVYIRPNVTVHNPEYLAPGANPITGWRPLDVETGIAAIDPGNALGTDTGPYDLSAGFYAATSIGHLNVDTGYAPGGFINGFIAPVSGIQRCTVHNSGGGGKNITLRHEAAAATAANRIWIATGADLVITPGETYAMTYSQARQRWVLAKSSSAATAPAGTTGEVQINSAGAFGVPGNVTAGSGYVGLGAGTLSTAGAIRLPYSAGATTIIGGKAAAGTNDTVLTQTGVLLRLGHQTSWDVDVYGSNVSLWGSNATVIYGGGGGSTVGKFSSTAITAAVPRHGESSPYSSDGGVNITVTASPHTATAAQYSRSYIEVQSSTLTTVTLTLPAPSNQDTAYFKRVCVLNGTLLETVTVSIGSGLTSSVTTAGFYGTCGLFLITTAGVLKIDSSVIP